MGSIVARTRTTLPSALAMAFVSPAAPDRRIWRNDLEDVRAPRPGRPAPGFGWGDDEALVNRCI